MNAESVDSPTRPRDAAPIQWRAPNPGTPCPSASLAPGPMDPLPGQQMDSQSRAASASPSPKRSLRTSLDLFCVGRPASSPCPVQTQSRPRVVFDDLPNEVLAMIFRLAFPDCKPRPAWYQLPFFGFKRALATLCATLECRVVLSVAATRTILFLKRHPYLLEHASDIVLLYPDALSALDHTHLALCLGSNTLAIAWQLVAGYNIELCFDTPSLSVIEHALTHLASSRRPIAISRLELEHTLFLAHEASIHYVVSRFRPYLRGSLKVTQYVSPASRPLLHLALQPLFRRSPMPTFSEVTALSLHNVDYATLDPGFTNSLPGTSALKIHDAQTPLGAPTFFAAFPALMFLKVSGAAFDLVAPHLPYSLRGLSILELNVPADRLLQSLAFNERLQILEELEIRALRSDVVYIWSMLKHLPQSLRQLVIRNTDGNLFSAGLASLQRSLLQDHLNEPSLLPHMEAMDVVAYNIDSLRPQRGYSIFRVRSSRSVNLTFRMTPDSPESDEEEDGVDAPLALAPLNRPAPPSALVSGSNIKRLSGLVGAMSSLQLKKPLGSLRAIGRVRLPKVFGSKPQSRVSTASPSSDWRTILEEHSAGSVLAPERRATFEVCWFVCLALLAICAQSPPRYLYYPPSFVHASMPPCTNSSTVAQEPATAAPQHQSKHKKRFLDQVSRRLAAPAQAAMRALCLSGDNALSDDVFMDSVEYQEKDGL